MTATPLLTNVNGASPQAASARVAFWPVFAWLAVQMLALLASVLRAPFSARFPAPAENLAIHEMLVVQMVASALLFPMLFPTLATGVIVVGSAPLMLQLAGVLAGEVEAVRWAYVCAYSAGWLIGLGLWSVALRTARARLYGVAAAGAIVVGGAMLAYLHREFGAPTEAFDWGRHGGLGPLVGAIAIQETGERTGMAWAFLGVFGLAATGAAGVTRFRMRKPPLLRS
jgi:hypothetical protein